MDWWGSVWVRTSQTMGPMRGVQRGHAVRNLRLRHDHERTRIAIQAGIVDIANDADDLPGGLCELRTSLFADDDLLAEGSSFGQYCFAMAWLMRTTPGAPVLSCSVKSRPRRMGILKAWK